MSQTNQYGQPVGFPLPDWQPVPRPAAETLTGIHTLLVPLHIGHAPALFAAFSQAEDDRDWTWLGTEMPRSEREMAGWIADKTGDPTLVCFAVIARKSETPVGVVCFSNIDTENGAIEIGHVTWSPLMQRTAMGTDAVHQLLTRAFSLGYRRAVWRCDALNSASRRAAERLGFTREGRFRQAMTRKQRNRDTDWFSILDSEWPAINRALSGWLSHDNFTADGAQIRALSAFQPSQ